MRDVFDIYTIIFLALAVFIFLRLRSVLGQRTGRERPPYDPYSAREPVRPAADKVVTLPNRTTETVVPKPAEATETSVQRWVCGDLAHLNVLIFNKQRDVLRDDGDYVIRADDA